MKLKFIRGRSRHFRNKKNINKLSNLPVSILKPLKGIDGNLFMNLESFFTMDYPKYELLFCVQDIDDPAIDVVKKLMTNYPKIDAQLVLGGSNVGINPKINNMNPGYERAKYDIIMISDDKMLIQSDALQEMVAIIESDENIGLVVQNPSSYANRPGFNAIFESIIFASSFRVTFLYHLFGRNFFSGMSTLYLKKIFEKAGGLKAFGKNLDEDVQINLFAEDNGWKSKMSRLLGMQNSENPGFKYQFERLRRWMAISTNTTIWLGFATVLMRSNILIVNNKILCTLDYSLLSFSISVILFLPSQKLHGFVIVILITTIYCTSLELVCW